MSKHTTENDSQQTVNQVINNQVIPEATDSMSFKEIETDNNQLKFAIAQSNFVVGDVQNNAKKMKAMAVDAQKQGADVVIFPELAMLGYPPEDLLLKTDLASRMKSALIELAKVEGVVIVVGYPHIDHHGTFNSAAILHEGQQKGFYHKQVLPSYGVFDEHRYFKKGRNQVLFDYKGVTIGLLISADIWDEKPIKVLKNKGAEVAIVINASPFEVGKQITRKSLLTERAQDNQMPIIYVNSVGGQDDLVFDGGSMVIQADGSLAHEAPRFLSTVLQASLDITNKQFNCQQNQPLLLTQNAEIYQALVVGLRDYVTNSGFNGVIVGLSGGVDSALSLCIAVDALGSDKVYAVMMPYKYTSQISLEDAEEQARRLNVSYTVCPIFDAVDGIRNTLAPLFEGSKDAGESTEENIQARARGMVLMALSNKFGHLVATTSNKSQLAIGKSTLYGDMAGGFDVLKDVYKTQVYQLANYRNRLEENANSVIPERVISRPPTKELRAKVVTAETMPDYEMLDKVLQMYIDMDMGLSEIVDKGFDNQIVEKIIQMVDVNEYKRRQSAIGTKISSKALSRERCYPVVNAWKY